MDQQIAVALYHRDHFSKGQTRKALGHGSYHWGIVIISKSQQASEHTSTYHVFEATDASEIDPATWRLTNPTMDWWLRSQTNLSGGLSSLNEKLLGLIVIGAAPSEVSTEGFQHVFEKIPLPVKNQSPQQSCVSWALDAVRAVQRENWVSDFDIGQFQDWALGFADERLDDQESRGQVVPYPNTKQ